MGMHFNKCARNCVRVLRAASRANNIIKKHTSISRACAKPLAAASVSVVLSLHAYVCNIHELIDKSAGGGDVA